MFVTENPKTTGIKNDDPLKAKKMTIDGLTWGALWSFALAIFLWGFGYLNDVPVFSLCKVCVVTGLCMNLFNSWLQRHWSIWRVW